MTFSVVIPLFNQAGTVVRAIRSVLGQTFGDYEVIVVNDGSEDDGPARVKALDDPRIRLIHQENRGVSAARNRGIGEAGSGLIAFLDADDLWLPTYLETVQGLANRFPACGLYATRYFYRNPEGRKYAAVLRGIPEDFEGILDRYFETAACSHPPVWTGAACARKKALNRIGGFPAGVASGEDLLTWARLSFHFQVAYSMKPLAVYHLDNAASYRDKPGRIPETPDYVGRELRRLFHESTPPLRNSLGLYCAQWHKMRCSCYLRLGMQRNARREIRAAGRYDFDFPLLAYLLVSLLPEAAIRKIFRLVMSFR